MKMRRYGFNLFAGAVFLVATTVAQAQSPAPSTAPGATNAQALQSLPEGCRKAAQDSQMGQRMQSMPMMQGTMPPVQSMPMMQGMAEANQGYMEAMQKMNPPMMAGMAINDPELAFLCSMIPHHQGAIDMAEVVLRHTKDSDIKKNAEKTIKDQKKDIEDLTELVKKHGK